MRRRFEDLYSNGSLLFEFNKLVENELYVDAFIYADKHTIASYCSNYNKLGLHWNKLIKYVLSLIDEDPRFYRKKVEELLRPYQRIRTKQNFINNILQNSAILHQANQAITNKDYQLFFALVEKHLFLKESGLFKQVMLRIEFLFEKVSTFVKAQSYHEALEILSYLKHNPTYKEKVEHQIDLIHKQIHLSELLHKNELLKAAKVSTTHPQLTLTKEYQEVAERFNALIQIALKDAYCGNPYPIKAALGYFYEEGLFRGRILALFERAFLIELQKAKDEDRKDIAWRASLEKYHSLFGASIEIEHFGKSIGINNISVKQIQTDLLPNTILMKNE